MITKKQIRQLKKELPLRAAYTIAEETGISRPTIYKFLNGGRVREYYAKEIMVSALKIIDDSKASSEILNKWYEMVFAKNIIIDQEPTSQE